MIINSIYSYSDSLLDDWLSWNNTILSGSFQHSATNFTEALGDNTSDGRTRAKEMYRIGLLNHELTKGNHALNLIKEGKNIQSNLGFITALIYGAFKKNGKKERLIPAISALNAIFSLLQTVTIKDMTISINTLSFKLLETFPMQSDIKRNIWLRYLLSAFFCTEGTRDDEIYEFLKGDKNNIELKIQQCKDKKYNVVASFTSSSQLRDIINSQISLTNIIQQKRALFMLGDPNDSMPRGFYSLGNLYFEDFLYHCYLYENSNLIDSPFKYLYLDEEDKLSERSNSLLHLKSIFNKEPKLNNRYTEMIKSIEDGAIEALSLLTNKPVSYFKNGYIQKTLITLEYQTLFSALRTKPFMLIAGISGTGKSRIVRKLAQATVTEELQKKYDTEYKCENFEEARWNLHKPANFEIIQVKPNWHNSMDVVGYLSNIPAPHYVFTPFVNFIVKAWKHTDVPFFLCLDEMNLAPVEEYFAEFLSAIESRSFEEEEYMTDPIIKPFNEFGNDVAIDMVKELKDMLGNEPMDDKLETMLRNRGLSLPKNLIVIGTVNMDETTFSFSRKVLDRAMSIEMNEVDFDKFLMGTTDDDLKSLFLQENESLKENINKLLVDRHIEAKEAIKELGGPEGSDVKFVISYLKSINNLLDGTQFKLGYRASNEALIYLAAAKSFGIQSNEAAMDDFTLMKILSRLEGDESKLKLTDSNFDKQRLVAAGVNKDEAEKHGTLSLLTALREIIKNNLGEYQLEGKSEEVSQDEEDKGNDTTSEPLDENNQDNVMGEAASTDINKSQHVLLRSIRKLDSMISQLEREHFVSYWN